MDFHFLIIIRSILKSASQHLKITHHTKQPCQSSIEFALGNLQMSNMRDLQKANFAQTTVKLHFCPIGTASFLTSLAYNSVI